MNESVRSRLTEVERRMEREEWAKRKKNIIVKRM